jgi:hypothetical protein
LSIIESLSGPVTRSFGGIRLGLGPEGHLQGPNLNACATAGKEGQSTEPAGTIHSHGCPVTAAIRSKSAS